MERSDEKKGKEKEEKESDGQRSGVNMTVEQGNVPRYQLYFFLRR